MGGDVNERTLKELIEKLEKLDELGLILLQTNADALLMRMKLAELEEKKRGDSGECKSELSYVANKATA